MLTHVVIFTWAAGVTGEQVDAFRKALDEMASNLASSAAIRHGVDLHFRDGNGDYALVAAFPDKTAWQAYQADPAHKTFVSEFVAPLVASRVSIQFNSPEA